MEAMTNLLYGFSILLSVQNILFCFLGCALGTLIGVLPGIGPMGAMAIRFLISTPPMTTGSNSLLNRSPIFLDILLELRQGRAAPPQEKEKRRGRRFRPGPGRKRLVSGFPRNDQP